MSGKADVQQIAYYECPTAADTAAKVVSATGFVLPTTGGAIKVKMSFANTADNPTLNINSTGAKPLYYDGAAASASNTWEAGETLDLYYDGTNWMANNVSGGGKFANGEKVKEVDINDYAKINGDYSQQGLVSAEAKNLTGEPIPVTTGYTLKATGYDPSQPELEFADGIVKMTEIQGRACAWNQLVTNGDFSNGTTGWSQNAASISASNGIATILATGQNGRMIMNIDVIPGHNYAMICVVKTDAASTSEKYCHVYGSGITCDSGAMDITTTNWQVVAVKFTADNTATTAQLRICRDSSSSNWVNSYCKAVNVIDVTLLNASISSKANLTVAEVEEYLASIRTPKPYYAQNAGQLLGAKMLGWQLRKTANLLNPTTKQAKLFEYAYTGHDNEYTVNGLPSDAAIKFIEDKVWNNLPDVTNLVTNGDFSDGTTGWGGAVSLSITNKIASFTTGQLTQNVSIINGHKYLFGFYAKTVGMYHCYFATPSSGFASATKQFSNVDYMYTKAIMTATAEGSTIKIASVSGAQEIHLTNVSLIDLTDIFGEGNEPTTVAEAELALFGIIAIDSNNHFVIPSQGTAIVINAGSMQPYDDLTRTSIVATWDGSKDGKYYAYEEDNVEIDSANIYYDNNGVKTQVFEGGILRSTGDGVDDVHDRVYFDEVAKKWMAEVNVGDVCDLGDCTWNNQSTQYNRVYSRQSFNDFRNPVIASRRYVYDITGEIAVSIRLVSASGYRIFIAKDIVSSDIGSDDKISKIAGIKLWGALATPVVYTSDLYYKVGNDYLPMEEVFPNGVHGLCCNWASENLVEQAEVDGQPQSITPVTTEIFQSDYKELLKTIGDTYISKEQTKDSFQNLATAIQSLGTLTVGDFDSNGALTFTFTPASE